MCSYNTCSIRENHPLECVNGADLLKVIDELTAGTLLEPPGLALFWVSLQVVTDARRRCSASLLEREGFAMTRQRLVDRVWAMQGTGLFFGDERPSGIADLR